MNENLIQCPECNKYFKNLKNHLFYIHKMEIKDFKIKYPDFGRTQIHFEIKQKKCPYCNVEMSSVALCWHLRKKHSDIYIKAESEKGFECPICREKFNMFSLHIERNHKIKWENFVKDYNWDKGKIFFTKEHKNTLSKNKKEFYQSIEGISLRKKASENYKKNNVSKRKDVREKISNRAIERVKKENHLTFTNYGYRIKWKINEEKTIKVRSFTEFKIIYLLEMNHIQYEYEQTKIKYFDEENKIFKNYLLDLYIDKKYYEIKSKKEQFSENKKYFYVNKKLKNIKKELLFLDYDLCKIYFNIDLELESIIIDFIRQEIIKGNIEMWYFGRKNTKPRLFITLFENYKEIKAIHYGGKDEN